jgi:hypothetical protein
MAFTIGQRVQFTDDDGKVRIGTMLGLLLDDTPDICEVQCEDNGRTAVVMESQLTDATWA